jgi:hypothetical protein
MASEVELRAQSGRGGETASVVGRVEPVLQRGLGPRGAHHTTPDLRAVSGNGANGARPAVTTGGQRGRGHCSPVCPGVTISRNGLSGVTCATGWVVLSTDTLGRLVPCCLLVRSHTSLLPFQLPGGHRGEVTEVSRQDTSPF